MQARPFSHAVMAAALTLVTAGASAPLAAQQSTGRIEGTVIDARTKQPMQGTTVLIPTLGLGGQTNDRGRYALVNVPTGEYDVQARRIGFANATKHVTVSAGGTVTADFSLTEAALSLEQVVVTGTAATTRAKEVATSTDIVGSQQFERVPVVNPQEILSGRVASVMVEANNGQPGSGGTIKIRGTNTLTQTTEPLIYVDGVRIFNELTRTNYGARSATNPLQDIPAQDIERIEIVKGAAATTLYGTEAAAGVIQIFTKKGMAGKPVWDAGATVGANTSPRWGSKDDPTQLFVECGNTSQMYAMILNDDAGMLGEREYFEDPTCPSDGNWTEPGGIQHYDLSLRGGSPNITYYVSGNYGDNRGILPTSQSKDGGFRGNFTFAPFDKVQLSLNSAYTRRDTRWAGDGDNSEGFLLNVGRGARNYLKGGKGDDCANVPTGVTCVTNGYVFDQTLTTRSDHFLSGFTVGFNPTAAFTNRFSVGWDYTDIRNITNLPFGFLTFQEGYFWDEATRHTKLSLDYAGSLLNNFSPALVSTFSWGGQLFRDRHRWTEIDVQNFPSPIDPTLVTGAELTYRDDLPTAVTTAGFFLQEQVGWQDRAFLTLGLRIDGSSAFGDNFGLQQYPKLGLAYVLSDHEFWPRRFVETFKLRAAIGESGKAPGAFDKLRTWKSVTGDEDQPGVTPDFIGNPDIGPERTREIEGGFDASILDGRLGLEFTAFQARTLDALVPVTLPPSQGFQEKRLANLGELRNSGVELSLNAALLRTQNYDWRARGNLSRMKSKAVDLGPQEEVYTLNDSYIDEGYAFPQYRGYMIANPNEIADPIVVSDTVLGLVNPNKMWGLGSTFTLFNNFTVDAFLEHQGGHVLPNWTAYQNARRGVWHPCYGIQEKLVSALGADKVHGTGDDNPAALAGVSALQRGQCAFLGSGYAYHPGYWTEKADFTKLRYVSVSYRLPARLMSANAATLTFSARNLYTWTDYSGADPEVQDVSDQVYPQQTFSGAFGRDDYYQIPQSRTYTLSLHVTF